MKKPLTILIMFSLLLISACAMTANKPHHDTDTSAIGTLPDSQYASKVNWNSLEEGIKKARAAGKPMLVDFAVHEGCERCEFLQANVYSRDTIVDKINKDFIPVFIDLAQALTPEERALGEKHEFHDDCLLLFLDHNRNPIFDKDDGKMCFPDKIEPEVFMDYLDYVTSIYNTNNIE
jgi:hypothetical protein